MVLFRKRSLPGKWRDFLSPSPIAPGTAIIRHPSTCGTGSIFDRRGFLARHYSRGTIRERNDRRNSCGRIQSSHRLWHWVCSAPSGRLDVKPRPRSNQTACIHSSHLIVPGKQRKASKIKVPFHDCDSGPGFARRVGCGAFRIVSASADAGWRDGVACPGAFDRAPAGAVTGAYTELLVLELDRDGSLLEQVRARHPYLPIVVALARPTEKITFSISRLAVEDAWQLPLSFGSMVERARAVLERLPLPASSLSPAASRRRC